MLLCFEYLPNGSLEKYINGMIVWCVMFLSISISFVVDSLVHVSRMYNSITINSSIIK